MKIKEISKGKHLMNYVVIIKLSCSWWGDGDNNILNTTSEGSKCRFRWESLILCRVYKSE